MISSTVRDLPQHREKVRDACLRQEFLPSMMENWPAIDADGVKASIGKVDSADVYIGVFGYRYGYIPKGSEISVTEIEYDRAVERGIPRLIFLMDEKHPLTAQAVDRGEKSDKLEKLKERLKAELTVSFFSSPDELLAKAIDSLSGLKRELAITTSPIQQSALSYDPRHSVFFVPFRSKGNQVVGRGAALDMVRKQLEHGHRTAIGQTASFAGLGGLGKTQLAVEYAYSFRDQYPNGVIWINADQDIDRQLIEAGETARWFAPESEHKDKLSIARHRVRTYSHTLLIFDNLQTLKTVADYLPGPQAEPHILVTSRSEHASFVPVPLEVLDPDLSLELLVQESGRNVTTRAEEAAAREIAEKLGGLPLALELAGAYLRHRPVAWEEYRDLLSQNMKAALPAKFLEGSFTRHEADLYSTLRVNSEVFAEEPLLKDILDVLTWSGPGAMGISLLSELLATSETNLTNAFGLGVALRLLQKVPGSQAYAMHQLVREIRREEVPLETRPDWALAMAERLIAWFQRLKRNFADLPRFESEMDHLRAWLGNVTGQSPRLRRRLIWLQAYPPFHRGKYKESSSFLLQARELVADSGEEDAELESNLLTDLCTIYGQLGEYTKAKECGVLAVEIRTKLFGEKHVETAMSLNNVGAAFRALGDAKTALEYHLRALAIWQELQGEMHIDTALALDNVSSSYRSLGDMQLALEFAARALLVREEVLGLLHPETASSLTQLGNMLGKAGKFDEALAYHRRALAIVDQLFGKRNILRSFVTTNIGTVHFDMGHVGEALRNFEEALEIRRELFGDTHPETVVSVIHCAWNLCHLGRVHAGHQMTEDWLRKVAHGTPQHSRLKETQRDLQRQFPRPGFRQPPRSR